MHYHFIHSKAPLALGAALILMLHAAAAQTAISSPLFTQSGSDLSFEALKAKGDMLEQKDSKAGVAGSKIHLNKELVEVTPEAKRPIPNGIRLHTLLNSAIGRKEFGKWSRWYQEDGNTQIFRLFKGETNLHNDRPLSARVETFSRIGWTEAQGVWHEWSGVVTGIKPCGSILQVKTNEEGPAVMILMNSAGTVALNHRRGKDKIIAEDMNGKPFLLRVRDNGHNYEVYYNGNKVGEGAYARPKGQNHFRWGMYVGEHEVKNDALILFSGVTMDGKQAK